MGFPLNSVTFLVHGEIHLNNGFIFCVLSAELYKRKQVICRVKLQSEKYAFE